MPGRATPVTRLATLTGLPNQSPARLTAMPEATPARRRGKSLSVSTASTSFTTTSSMGSGSGHTNITASPIVLMNRTGGTVTSRARTASRLARCPNSSADTASPIRVKPTRSAKATVIWRAPGSGLPAARSAALTASVSIMWRSCMNSICWIIGPSSGAISPTKAFDALAISSSVAPGRMIAESAVYRITSAARDKPSASTRTTSTTCSGSRPSSTKRWA